MFLAANYIKTSLKRALQRRQIKANLHYITHRPTLEGQRGERAPFSWDGELTSEQAHALIDGAEKGARYWRFKISPDPKTENPEKKLDLRDLTKQVMLELKERKGKFEFIAVVHNDHSHIDHVHAILIFKERLEANDFKALTQRAREAALFQGRAQGLLQRFRLNQTSAKRYIAMTGGRVKQERQPHRYGRVRTPRRSCPSCEVRASMVRLKNGNYWCMHCKKVQKYELGLSL